MDASMGEWSIKTHPDQKRTGYSHSLLLRYFQGIPSITNYVKEDQNLKSHSEILIYNKNTALRLAQTIHFSFL
uniref:N-acetyltransferase domain-containing protein n=1 Tax=Heterorhabditis bacteriophora TaxID=37862 RepID=A0A1I7WBE9_HETBA